MAMVSNLFADDEPKKEAKVQKRERISSISEHLKTNSCFGTLLQPTLTTGHRIAVGMATNCPKATVSVGRTRQAAPRIVLSSMAY